MNVYCLFEQSGIFKNQFKKLGFNSYDYDIKNDFNQTDKIIDLFLEIHNAASNENSIFDTFTSDDLLIAFFPCIRFEDQIIMHFQGVSYPMKNWTLEKKLNNCIKLQKELSENYITINELCLICIRRNLKLIIENPYSSMHYLKRYWCIKPKIIDNNRSLRGDFFNKPTQYFFINCDPAYNFIPEAITYNLLGESIEHIKKENYKFIAKDREIARSMISNDYAARFIKEYLIGAYYDNAPMESIINNQKE